MFGKSGLKAGLVVGISAALITSGAIKFTGYGDATVRLFSPLLLPLLDPMFSEQTLLGFIGILIFAGLIWGIVFEATNKYIPTQSMIAKGCIYAFIWWTVFGLAAQLATIWGKFAIIPTSKLIANLILSLVLWIFAGLVLGTLYSYFSKESIKR